MIFSAQQKFSASQVVTADAGSTNIIDLGATGTPLKAPSALVRDIGKGTPIPIVVQLDIAATGTSPTLLVTLQMDNDVAFGSPTTVATAQSIAGGAAGQRVTLYWIPEGTIERYIRLFYDVGGTSPSYQITAGIVAADHTNEN